MYANEALRFIRQGLQDVSLSRPKLGWGVPLPWDPRQVMYVWFDALLNYVTGLSFARDGAHIAALVVEPRIQGAAGMWPHSDAYLRQVTGIARSRS